MHMGEFEYQPRGEFQKQHTQRWSHKWIQLNQVSTSTYPPPQKKRMTGHKNIESWRSCNRWWTLRWNLKETSKSLRIMASVWMPVRILTGQFVHTFHGQLHISTSWCVHNHMIQQHVVSLFNHIMFQKRKDVRFDHTSDYPLRSTQIVEYITACICEYVCV